ncbi:hypothetical protein M422DRAFT_780954 [Sphaerobolus stellatus SS14]|uniref:Uncharacterized protein n=1 Tax=Sphaerobolus stellatus (strain SS14) TaxID=990650 RepID=A0A0C9U9I4_SPHS4|nr:hypothetical protein M422DRAFT_780954 [Sphaerobolus stellatus SS14]
MEIDTESEISPRLKRTNRVLGATTVHARTLGHCTLHDNNILRTFPSRPQQPLRRTDSLSSSIAKPKPTSPIIQSADDAKTVRALLETPLSTLKPEERLGLEERERRREEREGELVDMLAKMTGRMEELPTDPSKNQTDLETVVTLTRSNHQVAQTDARGRIKAHLGEWQGRRPAKVERVRRPPMITSLKDHHPNRSLNMTPSSTPLSATSRFFNFTSSFRSSFSSPFNTSPTTSMNPTHAALTDFPTTFIPIPALLPPFTSGPSTTSGSGSASPPPPPGPSHKEKLRMKAEELVAANKMVSDANRKAAETEEELRIVADQWDALKGAMWIVGSSPVFLYSRRVVHELFEGRSSNYSNRTAFLPYARLWICQIRRKEVLKETAVPGSFTVDNDTILVEIHLCASFKNKLGW